MKCIRLGSFKAPLIPARRVTHTSPTVQSGFIPLIQLALPHLLLVRHQHLLDQDVIPESLPRSRRSPSLNGDIRLPQQKTITIGNPLSPSASSLRHPLVQSPSVHRMEGPAGKSVHIVINIESGVLPPVSFFALAHTLKCLATCPWLFQGPYPTFSINPKRLPSCDLRQRHGAPRGETAFA